MTDISQIKVGVQLDINKYGSPVKSVPLETVLDKIASNETLKELTDKVRASEGSERDALKVRLPAVIISADTTCRKVSDEDTRTGQIGRGQQRVAHSRFRSASNHLQPASTWLNPQIRFRHQARRLQA